MTARVGMTARAVGVVAGFAELTRLLRSQTPQLLATEDSTGWSFVIRCDLQKTLTAQRLKVLDAKSCYPSGFYGGCPSKLTADSKNR